MGWRAPSSRRPRKFAPHRRSRRAEARTAEVAEEAALTREPAATTALPALALTPMLDRAPETEKTSTPAIAAAAAAAAAARTAAVVVGAAATGSDAREFEAMLEPWPWPPRMLRRLELAA